MFRGLYSLNPVQGKRERRIETVTDVREEEKGEEEGEEEGEGGGGCG